MLKQQKFETINELNDIYKNELDVLLDIIEDHPEEAEQVEEYKKLFTHVRNVVRTYLNYNRTVMITESDDQEGTITFKDFVVGRLMIQMRFENKSLVSVTYAPNWENHEHHLGSSEPVVLNLKNRTSLSEGVFIVYLERITKYLEKTFVHVDNAGKYPSIVEGLELKAFDSTSWLTKSTQQSKPNKAQPVLFETYLEEIREKLDKMHHEFKQLQQKS